MAGDSRDALQKRSLEVARPQRRRKRLGVEHQSENIRLGKHLRNDFKDSLPAPEPHEPVMDDGHPQVGKKVRHFFICGSETHALKM